MAIVEILLTEDQRLEFTQIPQNISEYEIRKSYMMLGPEGYGYYIVGGILGLLKKAGGMPIPIEATNACAKAFAKYIFTKLK